MSEQKHKEDPKCPGCQSVMGPTTAEYVVAKLVIQPLTSIPDAPMTLSFLGVSQESTAPEILELLE